MASISFKDKYHLTRQENVRFANQNLAKLVFISSRLEGLHTTLKQTQTIVDGFSVDGVSVDDINIIAQLTKGWRYMLRQKPGLTLDVDCS